MYIYIVLKYIILYIDDYNHYIIKNSSLLFIPSPVLLFFLYRPRRLSYLLFPFFSENFF